MNKGIKEPNIILLAITWHRKSKQAKEYSNGYISTVAELMRINKELNEQCRRNNVTLSEVLEKYKDIE